MIRRIIADRSGKMQRLRRLRRRLPRGRYRHGGRQGQAACGTTTATGWATACPPAPPGPSPLWSGRPRPMTRPPSGQQGSRRPTAPPAALRQCPGSPPRHIRPGRAPAAPQAEQPSRLSQWPVQIKLVPVNAPYFDGARLLIAADCTAYAYAAFHERFIRGRITLVGCPKLDERGLSRKADGHPPQQRHQGASPSCAWRCPAAAGWSTRRKTALQSCGKLIPWQVVTVTVDGRLMEE